MAERVALHTSFYTDPKFDGLSMAAERLYLRLIAWSGANETGGVCPPQVLAMVGLPRSYAAHKELITARLLTLRDDGRTEIAGWAKWNEHVDKLQKRRQSDRERQAKRRNISEAQSRDIVNVRGGEGREENKTVSSSAARNVASATAQPHETSTHFADGTPIPGEASAAVVPIRRDRGPTPSSSANALAAMHCPPGTPGRQIRDLAVVVQELIDDPEVQRPDLEAGLAAWRDRPGAGVRLLPSLVTDAAKARAAPVGSGPAGAMARGREWIDAGERAAQMLEAQNANAAKELE